MKLKGFFAIILLLLAMVSLCSCVWTVKIDNPDQTLKKDDTSKEIDALVKPQAPEGFEAEPVIAPRAVRIDGVMYTDTGRTSDMLRCGVMDGEIIYSVSEGELPSQDNESNFGVDLGYQYGFEQDTVEVFVDGQWCIFKAEGQDWEQDQNITAIPVTANSVWLTNGGALPCEISKEDAQTILAVLDKADWTEEASKCLFDISFNLEGRLYKFSSSCGSFCTVKLSGTPALSHTEHAVVNGYTHVTEEQAKIVQDIVSKYIAVVE